MSPAKICRTCGDQRIQLLPKGMYAQAQRCPDCFARCQLCGDLGYVFSADEKGREIAQPCSCRQIDRQIQLYNEAKMPAQFFDSLFANFDTKAHKSQKEAHRSASFLIKNYLKGDWKGLLLMGGVGVGKTRLVCALIHDMTIKHQIPCLFQEFTALLSTIKSQYDQGISETGLLAKISEVEILVIDELGKGRGSDWEVGILDQIISNRYAQKKTTLFTTNYTESKQSTYKEHRANREEASDPKTLAERVGPRIYSRLKGMCSFQAMDGPDRRLPENETLR
ncbi:MAG: ATP-binding protein [bacterium]|nr:ATP-binding protein [bacterium]